MTIDDIFKMFGAPTLFVIMGIAFWMFPKDYPNLGHHAPNDISRYISRNGISPAFMENFTAKQWYYIQKIAPKAFIVSGLLDACLSVLVIIFFPLWDKTLVGMIKFVFFLFATFLYIDKKSDNYKNDLK